MNCEVCLLDDGEEREMRLEKVSHTFVDPSDDDCVGETTTKMYVCDECGNEVEWEPEDILMDDDS